MRAPLGIRDVVNPGPSHDWAPPETLERFRPQCSWLVCLLAPREFEAISQFYEDFQQVEDEEVIRLLHESRAPQKAWKPSAHV